MRGRRVDPLDKRAMALSAGMHAVIFAVGWLSTMYEPDPIAFVTYEIEMVSPPPAVQAEEVREATEELVVERPEPEPPEPEPEEVVPVEEPEPEPEPEPPPEPREEPAERPPEAAEEVTVAATPEAAPEEPPAESGEGINVRIEGLRRDYPAYYENIIRQIQRCFRWRQGGSWQTTVLFWISRDGTATEIEFESRSGNAAFDFEAIGAVECAGQGRFGPLPEDLPYERFPIRFQFQPSGDVEAFLPRFGEIAGVTKP